jgi:hypothetical protein
MYFILSTLWKATSNKSREHVFIARRTQPSLVLTFLKFLFTRTETHKLNISLLNGTLAVARSNTVTASFVVVYTVWSLAHFAFYQSIIIRALIWLRNRMYELLWFCARIIGKLLLVRLTRSVVDLNTCSRCTRPARSHRVHRYFG